MHHPGNWCDFVSLIGHLKRKSRFSNGSSESRRMEELGVVGVLQAIIGGINVLLRVEAFNLNTVLLSLQPIYQNSTRKAQ